MPRQGLAKASSRPRQGLAKTSSRPRKITSQKKRTTDAQKVPPGAHFGAPGDQFCSPGADFVQYIVQPVFFCRFCDDFGRNCNRFLMICSTMSNGRTQKKPGFYDVFLMIFMKCRQ